MFFSLVWSAWLPHQTVNGSCVLCVCLSCMLNVFLSCVVCLVTPSDSKWLLCVSCLSLFSFLCFSLLCGLLCYPIILLIALVSCVFCSLFFYMFFSIVWSAWLSHQTVNGSCVLCVWLSCMLNVFLSCVVCLVTPSDSKWLLCVVCLPLLYVKCFSLLCGLLGYPIRQ